MLDKIIDGLKNEDFILSNHAIERMSERYLEIGDIQFLIKEIKKKNAVWSKEHLLWNFTGPGLDPKQEFTIACTYIEHTLIVTVFLE